MTWRTARSALSASASLSTSELLSTMSSSSSSLTRLDYTSCISRLITAIKGHAPIWHASSAEASLYVDVLKTRLFNRLSERIDGPSRARGLVVCGDWIMHGVGWRPCRLWIQIFVSLFVSFLGVVSGYAADLRGWIIVHATDNNYVQLENKARSKRAQIWQYHLLVYIHK